MACRPPELSMSPCRPSRRQAPVHTAAATLSPIGVRSRSGKGAHLQRAEAVVRRRKSGI